jgi:hypothetical protein
LGRPAEHVDTGFGLTVQLLPRPADRVLVLAQVAGYRQPDRWFTTTQLIEVFEALRLPRPGNMSAEIGRLAEAGLVVRRRSGSVWSLTPLGNRRVTELIGSIDQAQLAAQLVGVEGAELGHALHAVIPPSLAPHAWASGIATLLGQYPFDTNLFCMTRFPDERDEHVSVAIDTLRTAAADHGLTMHLASDRSITGDLWGNVAAHMWACKYGIGIFENRADRGLNYNVVIEVGAMLMTGRQCSMVRDTTAPDMPTDFVGQIYTPVDLDDPATVSAAAHGWFAEGLGLGRCRNCPT